MTLSREDALRLAEALDERRAWQRESRPEEGGALHLLRLDTGEDGVRLWVQRGEASALARRLRAAAWLPVGGVQVPPPHGEAAAVLAP